ncbi:ATP-binding protein [Actinomadura litoris]|uniref:histidine kinase n=1 Tax=Actinomadura litoris TaxID=2678616 RepID=A0A7K1LB54_9ACTN|nr:ATP-binding protein [Actinomadura litoris]MUN41661.1 hypothetical protein [Actinomadura litoris]
MTAAERDREEHAAEYARRLVECLTGRGLHASIQPAPGLLEATMGVRAVAPEQTVVAVVAARDARPAPHQARWVALRPAPQPAPQPPAPSARVPGGGRARGLFWHWPRPLHGHSGAGRYWFQPLLPAADVEGAAAAIAVVLEVQARERARAAHTPASGMPVAEEADSEVLDYVGRGVHALTSRTLERLKGAQNDLEDPDLLDHLYHVDHLVTQIRRAAERLAVLAGRTARRASVPLPVSTVLQQAMAEVEAFHRVRVRLPERDITLVGHAGPAVIHVLAELLENATRFSPPDTTVQMRSLPTPDGLGVEICDQGLTPSPRKLQDLQQILTAPHQISARDQVRQGQIGLLVAALLAARHGIQIHLRPQPPGTRALVILPPTLLTSAPATRLWPSPPPAPPAPPTVRISPALTTDARSTAPPGPPAPPGPAVAPTPSPVPTPAGPPSRPAQEGRPPLPQRRRPPAASPRPGTDPGSEPGPAPGAGSRSAPSPDLAARFTVGAERGHTAGRPEPAAHTEHVQPVQHTEPVDD